MTQDFYDGLAPYYHLLYPNWDASIDRQSRGLAHVLDGLGVTPGSDVLDAACGMRSSPATMRSPTCSPTTTSATRSLNAGVSSSRVASSSSPSGTTPRSSAATRTIVPMVRAPSGIASTARSKSGIGTATTTISHSDSPNSTRLGRRSFANFTLATTRSNSQRSHDYFLRQALHP